MRLTATILFLLVNLAVLGKLDELRLGSGVFGSLAITVMLSFLAVLVHELGHALAVRMAGGRIDAIMAAPFQLRLRPRRLKLMPPSSHGDLGGYVAYTPAGIETWRAHAIIAAAGPAANFVLAILAVILAAWLVSSAGAALGPPLAIGPPLPSGAHPAGGGLPPDSEVADSVLRYQRYQLAKTFGIIATALAALSAGMGLANLIPFAGSDGEAIGRALVPRWRR